MRPSQKKIGLQASRVLDVGSERCAPSGEVDYRSDARLMRTMNEGFQR